MSGNIRLYNTNGYVELQAPSSASAQVLELPTDSIKPALVHLHTETFSAVSSVSIDDVFSSEYETYMVYSTYSQSIGDNLAYRMRSGGVSESGSNYINQLVQAAGTSITGALPITNKGYVSNNGASNVEATFMATIHKPAIAAVTYSISSCINNNGSSTRSLYWNAVHSLTNSYDGIEFLPAGNFTGTLRIYGYRNS